MEARQFRKDQVVRTAAIIKIPVLKDKAGGTHPAPTGARKGTGGQAKAVSAKAVKVKAKAKVKAVQTAVLSSRIAALRQAIIMAAGTAAAEVKAKTKAKVKEEGITTTAAETKEVLMIIETAPISEITAAAREDAAKVRSSLPARRLITRRRRLSSAAI